MVGGGGGSLRESESSSASTSSFSMTSDVGGIVRFDCVLTLCKWAVGLWDQTSQKWKGKIVDRTGVAELNFQDLADDARG